MVKVIEQDVEILVNDKPIKKYYHNNKVFIEAKEGCKYKIKLKNDSYNKVLGIVSVDGLDVISGEVASDNSSGYILNAKTSCYIDGFRVSNDKVNAFIFTKKEKSYAAKKEAVDSSILNCGVIGVKFYKEKENIKYTYSNNFFTHTPFKHNFYEPYEPRKSFEPSTGEIWCSYSTTDCCIEPTRDGTSRRITDNSALYSKSQLSSNITDDISFDMGTQFGKEEIESKVKEESFNRGNIESFVEIYYASRKVLEEFGVVFDNKPAINFPESFPSKKYCKPPTS